jgi:RHS repeat-associated protein
VGLLALVMGLGLAGAAAAQSGPTYRDVVLRVEGDHFAVRRTTTSGAVTDGPRFLVMVSYFDALAALDAGVLDSDLDYLAYTLQVDGIRVFPNWWVVGTDGCYTGDATRTLMAPSGALNGDDPEGPVGRLGALLTVLTRARQRGLVVDVSLARETVPGLTPAGYAAGVARLATVLRPSRHLILDLQNEWDGFGYTVADLTALRTAVTTADPGRIVVASAGPSGTASVAGVGFSALAVHDPRERDTPGAWWEPATVTGIVTALRAVAPSAPIYFQEPMPWLTGRVWCGLAEPAPKAADGDPAHFRSAVLAAKTAGAAAWTFHTRQSFDLGVGSLRSRIQADGAEQGLLEGASGLAATAAAAPTWPVQAALEVLRAGLGDGTVTGPGGLLCGGVCTAAFPLGTVVTLNAVPATGQVFGGWSGVPGCTTATSCIVELTGATTVIATFGALTEPIVTFAHADSLGTLRVVTDATGAVVRRHDLLPFGEAWASPVPPVDRAIFTGQERDTETGFDYFGARYYRSDTGRFTTIDPVFTWKENLEDPQRWNRYAYVRNNPLKYVDPDGRWFETLWDVANVVMGARSAYDNFRSGNIVAGVVDTGGAIVDLAAAVVPIVPGGVGTAIKAARAVDRFDDAVDAARGSRTVIGRVKDLQDLKPGERSLLDRLPDRGSPKANWHQNAGALREEVKRGLPIRDASPNDRRGRFLNAERNLLRDRGWTFDKETNLWMPPKR